jgi:hypothetical protein
MKRFVLFGLIIFLSACSDRLLNTAQDFEVDLIGTEEAYCVLSTRANRYSLRAPGTAFIERDSEPLRVDCKDNLSDRRRVVMVKSEIAGGYYRYPDKITVDYATLDNGTRYNGFQATRSPSQPLVTNVFTQDSFSGPVETTQQYPVPKTHAMGRKSYPVKLNMPVDNLQSSQSLPPQALMPMQFDEAYETTENPSVTVYPLQ